MKAEIKKYLPIGVYLYYVDYDDDLCHSYNIVQECVENNNLDAISEAVFDWFDNPTGYYLDNIRREMQKDNCESLFDENIDQITEYLYDNDCSTPVEDLLNNTGKMVFYYDLAVDCDHGWHSDFLCSPWQNDTIPQTAYKIRRRLGIAKGSKAAEQIRSILLNSHYGGYLRIYFKAHLKDLICEGTNDFDLVKIKGKVALAVYNPHEGSGDYELVDIDCELPFQRENLALSKTDRYSIEECFGMSNDWCNEGTQPIFTKSPKQRKVKLKYKSPAYEMRQQEKKYEETFKAGGCTLGDTNIKRHRDVYYRNELPCGLKCPHCGQFWID
jgi:hypothetical protein